MARVKRFLLDIFSGKMVKRMICLVVTTMHLAVILITMAMVVATMQMA